MSVQSQPASFIQNKTGYNELLLLHRVPIAVAAWEYVFLLHPYCKYLTRMKILSYWFPASRGLSFFLTFLPRHEGPLLAGKVLSTFWKSQKLITNEKNQCVLVAKISFRKTKKSPIRKNKLSQKFRSTRYTQKYFKSKSRFSFATMTMGNMNTSLSRHSHANYILAQSYFTWICYAETSSQD